MADINVERKKPSVWPWVIGLLVLAVLLWAAVEMLGGDRAGTATGVDPDTAPFGAPAAETPGVAPAPGEPGAGPGAADPGAVPPVPPPGTPAEPDTVGAFPGSGPP